MNEPFMGQEYPLNQRRLDDLIPLLDDVVRESSEVRVSFWDLRLRPENSKAILPSREELEEIRRRGSQFYTAVLISSEEISPRYRPRLVGNLPIPLPMPISFKFFRIVAEIISELTGVRIYPSETSLIGENGRVVMPPPHELERMKQGARAYFTLLVSIDPDPIW